MNKHLDYLRNSHQKQFDNPIGSVNIVGVQVYIKEPVPSHINLRQCFSYVIGNMPRHLFSNVTAIHVGQFPFLKKRQVDAVFKDNIIYISNEQDNDQDIVTDLVHEIAHACEKLYHKDLYEDGQIENEFLQKRQTLYQLLKSNNLLSSGIDKEKFENSNYNISFDNYLYQTVGYDKLGYITRGLFISPYAATCLREYFANAFENFFVNDIKVVKDLAPNIYFKLMQFLEGPHVRSNKR